MKKDAYRNAMSHITASEETIEKILEKASEANVTEHKNIKMTVSRRARAFTAAAAVCAVMFIGATAAAAAGAIDFRLLFGWLINVSDDSLADPLLSGVSDISYTVSDEAYQLEVKGVTGDDSSIVSIVEISRVDGTPVTAHFLRQTDEKTLFPLAEYTESYLPDKLHRYYFGFQSTGFHINNKGNIEITFKGRTEGSLGGSFIVHGGSNFYPSLEYHSSMRENGVGRAITESGGGYFLLDELGMLTDIPAEFDDSALKLLELEWEISYRYEPSEAAMKKISCESPEEKCIFRQGVYRKVSGMPEGAYRLTAETVENTATVKLIEIGVLSGRVVIEYPTNDMELSPPGAETMSFLSCSEKNSVYLITDDGVCIPAEFDTGVTAMRKYGADRRTTRDLTVIYTENLRERILVEIDRINAISINGTVYQLD